MLRNEHNARQQQAYVGAMLAKTDLRRFPLDRLLVKTLGPKRRQTREEMIAVMRSIVGVMNAPKQRKR